MYSYRFLFHIHTFKSFDATITYKQLYKTIKKYNITHIAITEHNNIDSYEKFKNYLSVNNCKCNVIPAVEYTTEIGDIIVLNYDKLIQFNNYLELFQKIKILKKENEIIVILPHPFKRKNYPKDILQYIEFYEILNMRGIGKHFNATIFKDVKYLYGVDAHNFNDLPGVINVIYSSNDFLKALKEDIIIPEIYLHVLKMNNIISKIISKIKKKLKK